MMVNNLSTSDRFKGDVFQMIETCFCFYKLTCVHWIRPMWKAVSNSENLDFRVNLIKNYRISQRLIPASSILGSHVPRGPSDKTFTSYHFNISLYGQFISIELWLTPALAYFYGKVSCVALVPGNSSIERRKKDGAMERRATIRGKAERRRLNEE